jgi:hypothetical protein
MAQSGNTVQSIHKSTTGLTLHSHAITQYLYLVSTENLAIDPFIYMITIERFYNITISLNVHTINMNVFSLIDRAEKILYCEADEGTDTSVPFRCFITKTATWHNRHQLTTISSSSLFDSFITTVIWHN